MRKVHIHIALLWSVLAASGCWAAEPAPGAPAPAATEDKPAERAVWINLGGFSHHFSNNNHYNETNRGLGVEYRINADWAVMAGSYYNSVRRTTTYGAFTYQPLSLWSVKIGASVGVMDGYPAKARGGTFFAALPMATYEGSRFGLNLGLIPSMPKVDGAIVLQLKVRVL